MPFKDPEARRAWDRAKYRRLHGLPDPGDGDSPSSSASSLPEFIPRQERLREFQPSTNWRKSSLMWMRDHWREIGVGIAGVTLIVGAVRYREEIKAGLASLSGLVVNQKKEESRALTETEKSDLSMGALLDFANGVMQRAAATG